MAHINRLRCAISNAPGLAGDLTIAAAYAGHRSFGATHDGQSFDVVIADEFAWEVRTGCVYNHGTSTLSRGTLSDSSTGAAIALTAAAVVTVGPVAGWFSEIDSSISTAASVAAVLAPTVDMLAVANRKRRYITPAGVAMRSNATDSAAGSGLVPDGAKPLSSICFFGDSTTQYAIGVLGNQLAGSTQGFGASYNALWVDNDCPSGAGTLTYNAGTKTLTWAPNGLGAGAAVDASGVGFLKVPGPSAGQAVYLVWFGNRAYTSGTSTITAQVNGFQGWSYSSRSHVVPAMAAVQWRYRLAALPAGCPPGMDGIYGLGGAGSQELLAAYPQWSQIRCDIAVLQVGTNDISGGVTADQYVGYVKEMCERLFAAGTQLIVWCTILPRNADTAAQMRRKARAADLMRQYAIEKAGRVAIFDMASVVTNPANGQWRAGMSGDGIHYTAAGGTTAGYALGDYLATLNAASVLLPASYQDTYDALEHPNGNGVGVATAGMQLMQGTGGTAGTGASGSIATGWTVQRQSGAAMTLTCSKVARTDGVPGDWQQIVLAGAAANETGRIISSLSINAGLIVGQQYTVEMEVRIVSSVSLNLLQGNLSCNGVTARNPEGWQGQGTDVNADVSAPRTIWIRIPPGWTMSAGATSYYPIVQFGTAAGGSATLQIGRVRVAKA